jgi:hypothetical protein
MNKKQLGICTLGLLMLLSASARSQQPANAQKVCDLYGNADQGKPAFNQTQSCDFAAFPLNRNYHQGSCSTHGGDANSTMSCSEIPAGIYIEPNGTVAWAVFSPSLVAITDDNDQVVSRRFSMKLYCGPEPPPGAGCNVKVAVYAVKK